jgi:hypothetical protein
VSEGYYDERIARLEQEAGLPPYTPPHPPPLASEAPTGLKAVVGDDRSTTCTWQAVPNRDDLAYEVHEFLTDPANTLKATVSGTSRTSTPLRGGRSYEWGVRARDRDGGVSQFSEHVTVFVAQARPPAVAASGNPILLLPILAGWTLMQPVGAPEDPENDYPTHAIPDVFFVRDGGVVYRAPTTGVTSKGSHYPRCESREMRDRQGTKAAWSNKTGTHTLTVDEAFTQLPSVKPEVVGVQIHDGKDDVLQIRLEGSKLFAAIRDGRTRVGFTDNYKLGTRFVVQIVAANSRIKVFYNGAPKADFPLSGSSWFWKVGAYVQSSPDHGDGPGNFGEVTVYSVASVHA